MLDIGVFASPPHFLKGSTASCTNVQPKEFWKKSFSPSEIQTLNFGLGFWTTHGRIRLKSDRTGIIEIGAIK